MSSSHRTIDPSPLAGEGAKRTLRVSEAGEGVGARNPSPGRSLRSRPPSPARGEGKNRAPAPKVIRRDKFVLPAPSVYETISTALSWEIAR